MVRSRFRKVRAPVLAALGVLLLMVPASAQGESRLRIAAQYGIGYLPFLIMEKEKLVEKHAAAAGIAEPRIEWLNLGGGGAVNEALVSGSIDIAAAGPPVFLTVWDKTRGNAEVRGLASLNNIPTYLNTTNPAVRSIADFTERDKIALPAVKVSYQALTLQLAAEQLWGKGQHDRLDRLTVSMPHPEAQSAMLSSLEITAHFATPPFMYTELKDPRVRKVLSSYDVFGEPVSFNVLYTTKAAFQKSPKLYEAFVAALRDSMKRISEDKASAAAVYVKQMGPSLDVAFVAEMLNDPSFQLTATPRGVLKMAEFMARIGRIKTAPADIGELFFLPVPGGS